MDVYVCNCEQSTLNRDRTTLLKRITVGFPALYNKSNGSCNTPKTSAQNPSQTEKKGGKGKKKKKSQLTIASRSIFAAAKASSITATLSLLLGNIMTGIVGPARPGKSPRQSAMFSGSFASGLGVTSNAHRIRMIATARERSATLYPGQILF